MHIEIRSIPFRPTSLTLQAWVGPSRLEYGLAVRSLVQRSAVGTPLHLFQILSNYVPSRLEYGLAVRSLVQRWFTCCPTTFR